MGVWGGGGGRLRRIFPERKKKDVRLNKNVSLPGLMMGDESKRGGAEVAAKGAE